MKVTLKFATPEPVHAANDAAALCYGKEDYSPKRVKRCIGMGHDSIAEHVYVSFLVQEVSRSCTHQLVRHRLASYNQKSQRYCKMKLEMCDWFVVPQTVKDAGHEEDFVNMAEDCLDLYCAMMKDGVPAEDARYILPEGTHTEIIVTMNARELFHFFELRMDKAAQWEIRELAETMYSLLEKESEEWVEFLEIWKARQ